MKTCFLFNPSQDYLNLLYPLGCSPGACIDALDTLPMTAEEITGPGFASAASAGDVVAIEDSQDQKRNNIYIYILSFTLIKNVHLWIEK